MPNAPEESTWDHKKTNKNKYVVLVVKFTENPYENLYRTPPYIFKI